MQKLLKLKPVILKAGEIALKYFNNSITKIKSNNTIVTQADLEIEKYLKNIILENFPDDGFIGEEEGINHGESNDIWIIDPIDGTVDFANSLANWSISIALMRNSEIIEGVVYAPLLNSYYYAQKGLGSYKNDQIISGKTSEFNSFNYFVTYGRAYQKLNFNFDMRMTISTHALIPCLVADGSTLGSITYPKNIWDFAASYLIAKEAKLEAEYLDGRNFNIIDLLDCNYIRDFVLIGNKDFINLAKISVKKYE